MARLHHYPLCPHSRFVRLILAEYGVDIELVEERAFDRRPEFLALDPAGRTPILVDGDLVLSGASVIAEFIDETLGRTLGEERLMPEAPEARAEARRLSEWFNLKFFQEVSGPLVSEKVYKRFIARAVGSDGPDMEMVRAARANIRYHLRYLGYLAQRRNWLAGERLTYADLAAAAHLSCADFLGDAPWSEDEQAKLYYARIKSRPSFRALLVDRVPGLTPPDAYADLDF